MTESDLNIKQQLMLSENFKITIINMLKDPVEKVGNIYEQMGKLIRIKKY